MHVPDGFLDAPTSLATGAVAVVGVAAALRGARRELDDRTAPMAGLVATFLCILGGLVAIGRNGGREETLRFSRILAAHPLPKSESDREPLNLTLDTRVCVPLDGAEYGKFETLPRD